MNKLRLMVSNIFFPVLLILVLVSWAYAKNGKDMSSIKALLNVRIIDGKTEQPLENGVLIIKDDLIVAVGNRAEITIPQSAQVINLKEMTIMPGLIDAHCHVCFYHLDPRSYTADEPDEILALRAAQNFKTLLETGVTTVRDTGGYKEITRSLKRALFMNLISGPNYFHSGRIITNSGGHGWKVSEIADGREEIIRSIRKRFPERANQCDFIKITWNRPGGYSHEEIKAAIETTHSYGKRIAIHAYQSF